MPETWELFPHAADVGVRGYGASKAEAFEQAATELTAVITDPARVRARQAVPVRCEAPDDELLLVDWLNRLILEMDAHHLLVGRFSVELGAGYLNATAWGEPLDRERHCPAVEVKGATYTALRVACEQGRWLAQTVVDV